MFVAFWLKLGPFWCHVGPHLGYFAPSGVSFWLVLGEIQFLRQKFVKKHSCIDPGIKFLANFRMQTIFPRPGGGTIAAGNRDLSFLRQVAAKGRPRGTPGPIAISFGCHWARYQFCIVFGQPLVGPKIDKDRDTEGFKADQASGEASEYTRLRSRKRHLQQRPATLKACFRNIEYVSTNNLPLLDFLNRIVIS